MVTQDAVLEALRAVRDPDAQQDIVSLGLIRDLTIADAQVSFTLAFTTQSPASKAAMHSMASRAVQRVPGVEKVQVKMGAGQPGRPAQAAPHAHGPTHAHGQPKAEDLIPEVKQTIAVSSGKGGVGKSTVAVNVALALAQAGARVGILDADIYGPSQPRMLGLMGRRPETRDGKSLEPLVAHGLEAMSIGFLVDDRQPMAWRGPMVTSALNQLLTQTNWGDLDYLIVDMPPGTGDIQLTLAQRVPVSGAVIVTTPQDIALADARKGLEMFQKVNVPVLGVVENMSLHVCTNCGHEEHIFGEHGGETLSTQYGVPLLGALPLDRRIRVETDEGKPTVVAEPDGALARAFRDVALRAAGELAARAKDYSRLFPSISVEDD
jgi:ATP-binding protein involved in chromosome partitioning